MSRLMPAPGDYTAKCTGQLKIIQAETGTLGVAVPYRLTDSEVPFSDTHVVYVAKSDGTLLTANIDNLKKVFGWDGQNPWWLMWEDVDAETGPRDFSQVEFKLADCKHDDSYTPDGKSEPVVQFKPSWLNPLDGGRNFKLADKASVMKQFGSKFRANSGGAKQTPAKTPAKTTGGPLPRKKVEEKPVEPCTADEAFVAYLKSQPGKTMASHEQELSDGFYAAIDKMFPDATDAEKLTKEQYGKLRASFGA